MHGSEKALVLKEKFMAEVSRRVPLRLLANDYDWCIYVKIARHPAFKLSDIHDLSKDELRERTMEKFATMVYFVTNESLEVFTLRMQVCSLG